MTQNEVRALFTAIAVETLVMDLTDVTVPVAEARARVARMQAVRDKRFLAAEYNAGAALIALETLGYDVRAPVVAAPDASQT